MAYEILINGVDRTTDVINSSIIIEDTVNEEINTCKFQLIDRSGNGIPETDDEIVITSKSGSKIFGGYITDVSMKKYKMGVVGANFECVDYTYLLDRNLVKKVYKDQTDKEIIEDIVNTYCFGLGITTNNVIEGVTISQISFNYIQPSQALRRICELTGRNWYIDYDKDIHYFPLTTATTPFNINSTSNEYWELELNKSSSQLKNRVYVRGGTKLSDETSYSEKGDGEKRKFILPDKPHDVTVKVNGVTKTLGIKNIDTSGFDWYLSYQEKYIEQDSGGSTLSTSDTLQVYYKYDIPILVAVEDTDSIAENGQKEFAIFDKTITTTQSARDRASAELTDYANDLISGSFKTREEGFISGQYININLSEYGVNDNYLVQKVLAVSTGAGTFEYTVFIANAKTLGIIKFLIELLEADKNLIELDDDEVVDELLQLTDSLNADSLLDSLVIDSAGAYATWCEGDETTPKTRARWDLFQWG